MCSMPSRCPTCGSDKIRKEYHLGAQTGDWICSDCKNSGWIGHDSSKKEFSAVNNKKIIFLVNGNEAGSLMKHVSNSPDENDSYGYLKRDDIGIYEKDEPLPIRFEGGRLVVHIVK